MLHTYRNSILQFRLVIFTQPCDKSSSKKTKALSVRPWRAWTPQHQPSLAALALTLLLSLNACYPCYSIDPLLEASSEYGFEGKQVKDFWAVNLEKSK